MPNKQAIIENVDMYSADELVKYIKAGIVTFKELCDETEGYFPASVRKEVEKKLSINEARQLLNSLKSRAAQQTSASAWESVNKNSEDELRRFVEENPHDSHIMEAKKILNRLIRENFVNPGVDSLKSRILEIETDKTVLAKHDEIYKIVRSYLDGNKLSHEDFLEILKKDNNLLGAQTLNKLIDTEDKDYLSFEDLSTLGIDGRFISFLAKKKYPILFDPPKEKMEKINKLSTEAYFWGIPSSGKSCALGAILSVAKNGRVAKSMMMDNDCIGYGYMNRLSSLFSTTDVSVLPGGTPVSATYEMGFDLEDNEGKIHPITCMDLAGELMRCMYRSDAGENLNNQELETLDIVTNALINPETRTKNKKIHFFVMEYGAEEKEYGGLKQDVYLNGALQYIKRTGIFKNDTVAIYIIITKVDKAEDPHDQLGNVLKKYISENYGGFYNGLVRICNDYEINNGEVEVIPFSLGQVCLKDYCLFDERPAANIVRKLLERTKGFKNDRFHRGLNIFKK